MSVASLVGVVSVDVAVLISVFVGVLVMMDAWLVSVVDGTDEDFLFWVCCGGVVQPRKKRLWLYFVVRKWWIYKRCRVIIVRGVSRVMWEGWKCI